MNRIIQTITILALTALVSGCMPVNHFKLNKRYREDTSRFETLKKSSQAGSEKSLERARKALDDARRALKRWDHERARTMLDLAEEHLKALSKPSAIPEPLRKMYAPLDEAYTPETPFP